MTGIAKHKKIRSQEDADVALPRGGKLTWHKVDNEPGLSLAVQPTGFGTYFVTYFVRDGAGKRLKRTVRIGTREPGPAHTTLAQARKKARGVIGEVADGGDPVGEQRTRIEDAKLAVTFNELADMWLANAKHLKERTKQEYRAMLTYDVSPVIGYLPADTVERKNVAAVLAAIEKRGSTRRADHVKVVISSAYKWGLDRELVQHNPARDFKKRHAYRPRERVLTNEEIATFWNACERDDLGVSEPMRIILRIPLLTAVRRSEIVAARKSELAGLDTDTPTWTIPGERTKNSKDHVVHLSKPAAALFKRALELSRDPEWVFPVDRKRVKFGTKPKSEHVHRDSAGTAMQRLRFALGIEDITLHDLRRTVSTWMGEQMISVEVRRVVVNHAPKIQDITERVYNQAKLAAPVRRALQAWADHVEHVAGAAGETRGNVVELASAAGR